MPRIALLALLTILIATTLALAWTGLQTTDPPALAADRDREAQADPPRATEERLAAVEAVLAQEQARARALAIRVESLEGQLAVLATRPAETTTPGARTDESERLATAEPPVDATAGDPEAASSARIDRLVAAGFDADQAEWIVRRESELEMEALQRRYEATQAGEPLTAELFTRRELALRDELGEEDYARYREATGRATRIRVDRVLASSPAEAAGVQPGDEILAYDGQRVFDTTDLQRLTLEGRLGQNVTLRLLRDGVERLVVLPRGPIGVQTRGVHGGSTR